MKYTNFNFLKELFIGFFILIVNILILNYGKISDTIKLISKLLVCLNVFTLLYFILASHNDEVHFKKENKNLKRVSLWDCFYFAVVTQSTIGYGNMRPSTLYAEMLVTLQAISTLLVVTGISMLKL